MNMLKRISILLLFFVVFTTHSSIVFSQDNRDIRPNNKFGMHIAVADDGDIQRVAELVNSNGGDWGYITIVIQENDRDRDKWQGIFNKLRDLHLIPIIRIATQPQGPVWRRPKIEEAQEWADFLDSLNWVVKERYVTIFNEPNHGQEWGGSVDPVDYARVAEAFAEKLKEKNSDFFIMPAGFDVSAPASPPNHHNAEVFMHALIDTMGVDKFNYLFDGWASHSYPNPNFAASVHKRGRESIGTYDWELRVLASRGVKPLPVFIKETGWNGDVLSREQIAENFRIAFNDLWIPDDRVRAVTPFILNYQGEPFLKFSWVKPGNNEFNPEYFSTLGLAKQAGDPYIFNSGDFQAELPSQLSEDSEYNFRIRFRNTGQAIWDYRKGYRVVLEGINPAFYKVTPLESVHPFDESDVNIKLRTTKPTNKQLSSRLAVYKGKERVYAADSWQFSVEQLPQLSLKTSFLLPTQKEQEPFTITLYDEWGTIVHTDSSVYLTDRKTIVSRIKNIEYGKVYQVEIKRPYYVPQREQVVFTMGDTSEVEFVRLLPLDFTLDGRLSLQDATASLKQYQFVSTFSE